MKQNIAHELGLCIYDSEMFIAKGFALATGLDNRASQFILKLMAVWMEMKSLSGPELFKYIEREVWPNNTMTIFMMQKPLEWVLFKHHGQPLTPEFLRFIMIAIDRGADGNWLATALVPSFAKSLSTHNDVSPHIIANILATLSTICDSALLQDCNLLDSLGMHLSTKSGIIFPIVRLCLSFHIATRADFKSIVYKLHYLVSSSATLCHMDSIEINATMEFFDFLSNTNEWHRYMSHVAIGFIRKDLYPRECHNLFISLLSSTSVYLVVMISREKLITRFRDLLKEVEWLEVLNLLDEQYPPLCPPQEQLAEFSDDYGSCPITLCPFVKPVVASDGQTYERHAILHHMVVNGMTSPITKETLEYKLFYNWSMMPHNKRRCRE